MTRDAQPERRAGRALSSGWELTSTPPSIAAAPHTLEAAQAWLPASVPGTVASALQQAGLWNLDAPTPLDDRDYWYHCAFHATGLKTLRLHGLASIAEVWLNGQLLLRSENMFLAHDVPVELDGDNELYLCFRSLASRLALPAPRARWRQAMIVPPTLRTVRTTLLGHMPGWCPPVHAIGPWRTVELLEPVQPGDVEEISLRATLSPDGAGTLRVQLLLHGRTIPGRTTDLSVECAGTSGLLSVNNNGWLTAELHIPDVDAWWPHTHGTPVLHQVTLHADGSPLPLGRVGFRRIEADTDTDGRGFALVVNGVRIFARGACWTTADIVALPEGREAIRHWIETARDANMNLLRVGGTMVYEASAFYELCDELGVLVWQDFMFANMDYPIADASFAASVRAEATQFLRRTESSPCLAVLCGGSEVSQQAAMLGLSRNAWNGPLFASELPSIVRELRPDVPYVPNSPFGGDLPFCANASITHYYGVGAYLRPLDDARRAEVRFATESLAFSNVPGHQAFSGPFAAPGLHDARWKSRVPRDNGSSWDFEDVRDHYLQQLYKVDAGSLRREEGSRYLAMSRAVTGEVMEAAYAEWRRARSTCAGALVWTLQDLWPGAGWGVVDSRGEPKAAWYALRRAMRPVQVTMTDEGVNGLAVHVINDRSRERRVRLEFACYAGSVPVVRVEQVLTLPPHSAQEFSASSLLAVFFDTTYAYRFGPPAFQVAVAIICDDATGTFLADAFHFPLGRGVPMETDDITMHVERDADAWALVMCSSRVVQSVQIDDDHHRPDDNWFHLAPKVERRIRLQPRGADGFMPCGEVRALNRDRAFRYSAAP